MTYVASYYASEIGMSDTGVVALWPAAGISMWGCWRYGWQAAITGFFGFWAYGLLHIEEGYNNLLPSIGNAFAAWVGAKLVARHYVHQSHAELRNMLHVICTGGLVLAVISAGIGATHLASSFGIPTEQLFTLILRWFLSDVAGVVITAPFLFAMTNAKLTSWRRLVGMETAVAVFLCLALTALVNSPMPELSASAVILLASAPVVAWVVLRPSRVKALGALSIIGIVSLTLGARVLNVDNSQLLETQLFTLMFMTAAFLLHELLRELRDKNAILENHKAELESAVTQRTYELLEAKQKAESADQAKTEFLANTSHEVRTPLNAILGMAEFLAESNLPTEQKSQVSTIISSGKGLMALLNDVIDLSKVEAGKLEIHPEACDLVQMADDLRLLWTPKAEAKKLTLQISCSNLSHQYYLLDGHRLRQCLSNLISNAVKFSTAGKVSVNIKQLEDRLRFTVQDCGPGIDAKHINKLFQPFEQLDQSITREYGGTGLGLAIVKKLIELMRGEVSVSSTASQGSTFTLELPATPTQAQSVKSAQIDTAILEGKRVLLVEDNPVNRLVAKGHLRKLDLTFDEAENGEQCLELLASKSYDLVLLDIHMPVMDGIETIKRIRATDANWRNIPVIALTADAMRDDRKRLLDEGMNGYASKPINRNKLFQEMAWVLSP